MEPQPRVLPTADLQAIFGVLVTVHSRLLADQLPADLTAALMQRLIRHGPLAEGASAGEMNALLADLCQRMHWAMSEGYGDYPESMPRRTIYVVEVPEEAVDGCMTALVGQGGQEVALRRVDETEIPPNIRQISATFADLPPDPGHQVRVDHLSVLAQRYGGRFAGFGG
ncbi:hypothetical protein [Micromonospora sp. NPDC005324]|uniref:hypothetical protein n=1 Tax=Micromonospora sp. NPDC005324 TaxID=3157033 RepID=UPI0033B5182F